MKRGHVGASALIAGAPMVPSSWRRLLLLAALCTAACNSSSNSSAGGGCADDPTQCQAGTTCWPADSVPNLRCLPSLEAGIFGASCQQTIGAATCGDGLACDQLGADGGVCTYYCGAQGHGCPPGYTCDQTHVGGSNGPAIDICRSGGSSSGGGDDASGDGSTYIDANIPIPDAGPDGSPNMQ